MYQHWCIYCPASCPIQQLPTGIPVASRPSHVLVDFFFKPTWFFYTLARLPAVVPRSRIPACSTPWDIPTQHTLPFKHTRIPLSPVPRSCGFFSKSTCFFMLLPASLLSFPLPLPCLPAPSFPPHFLLSGRDDPRAQRASAHARTLTCACTHLFHWFIGKGMM